MTRLRAWLLNLLIGDVYVVADGPKIVGVAASLQGAELVRVDHARQVGNAIGGSEEYKRLFERQAYDRQRIELHRVRDV